MTCIAFDGKTLAADKRMVSAGLSRTCTKIYRVGGSLVGFAGNGTEGMEMLEWIRAGCSPSEFPDCQRDKDTWTSVLLITDGKMYVYERDCHPMLIEDPFFAMGSGRDYALAAMHLGKTAKEAVEIACLFDVSCGNGIDTLEPKKTIVTQAMRLPRHESNAMSDHWKYGQCR